MRDTLAKLIAMNAHITTYKNYLYGLFSGMEREYVDNYGGLWFIGNIVRAGGYMATYTESQRNALHLYCDRVAQALNDAGYDLKLVLEKKPIPVSCTKENIKENLWKPIQKALYNKKSTTELDKMEVSDVYDHMNRWLGETFGIYVEFPHGDEK